MRGTKATRGRNRPSPVVAAVILPGKGNFLEAGTHRSSYKGDQRRAVQTLWGWSTGWGHMNTHLGSPLNYCRIRQCNCSSRRNSHGIHRRLYNQTRMLGLPRGTFQNCNRGRTPPRTDSAGTTPVQCPFRLTSRIGSPTPAYICPRHNSDRASRQRDVRSLPATRRSLQRE